MARRNGRMSSFSESEIDRAISTVVGTRAPVTPSKRILRNVGNAIAHGYTPRVALNGFIEDIVRICTKAKPLEPEIFVLYTTVAKKMLENRMRGKEDKPTFDQREPHPQRNASTATTA